LASFEFCAVTVFLFRFFFFSWICRQQGREDFCLGFAVKSSCSYCKVSFLNIRVIGVVFDQIFMLRVSYLQVGAYSIKISNQANCFVPWWKVISSYFLWCYS